MIYHCNAETACMVSDLISYYFTEKVNHVDNLKKNNYNKGSSKYYKVHVQGYKWGLEHSANTPCRCILKRSNLPVSECLATGTYSLCLFVSFRMKCVLFIDE